MKVVSINGSYRKKGATSFILNNVIDGIKAENPSCTYIPYTLSEEHIEFCKGCMACLKEPDLSVGKCHIQDGYSTILDHLLTADLVILASPIYEGYITAMFKKFQERSLPLSTLRNGRPYSRSKKNTNRYGITILVSGVPSPINHLVGIVKQAKRAMKETMKALGVGEERFFIAGDVFGTSAKQETYREKAVEFGKKISKEMSRQY